MTIIVIVWQNRTCDHKTTETLFAEIILITTITNRTVNFVHSTVHNSTSKPDILFVPNQVANQSTSFIRFFPPPFLFFFSSVGSKPIDRIAFSVRASSILPQLITFSLFGCSHEPRANVKFDQLEKMTADEKSHAFPAWKSLRSCTGPPYRPGVPCAGRTVKN